MSAWSTGILQYIKEHSGYSLTGCQCWGNWNHDSAFNSGEYAIFDLPDFRQYDGIIVDLTNIEDSEIKNRIARKVLDSGTPAVTICDRVAGITCVRSDNYHAICRLFDHLWDHHGCRTFFFAGSDKKDSESAERENAFVDSCHRHGIAVTPDMLLNHDFSSDTGVLAARQFFPKGNTCDEKGEKDRPIRPIPDAFVCANDNIAVGLIMEMRRHGYECPRDFKLTGFDNLDKAMYYQPQISTASLNRERIAYTTMETLDRMIHGMTFPPVIHIPVEIVLAESCGCPTSDRLDLRAYLAWQIEDGILVNRRNEQFSMLASDLNPSLSIRDLMHQAMMRYAAMDVDGVYMVLDDRIGNGSLDKGYTDQSHLCVIDACERGKDGMHSVRLGNMQTLRRHLCSFPEGSFRLIFPLHIGSLSAGFILLYNPRFLVQEWRIYEFQDIVLHALSEWDTNRKLRDSLEKLRDVYYRDCLTSFYSTTAFEPKLLPWISGQIEKGRQIAVLFIDIDRFKQINDTHGHAYGDYILRTTASCIRSALPKSSFSYRYGGDEFVSIVSYTDPASVSALPQAVWDQLLDNHISASIGLSYLPADCPPDHQRKYLLSAIQAADRDMYRQKEKHHASR